MSERHEGADGYQGLEELTARARELGAVRITSSAIGFVGEYYHATTLVETEGGQVYEAAGYAKAGDMRTEDGESADEASFPPPQRAEVRSRRAALRLAYGREALEQSGQPKHVKMAQATVRSTAEQLGRSRDDLAAELKEMLEISSLNDLSPKQATWVATWCAGLGASARRVAAGMRDE